MTTDIFYEGTHAGEFIISDEEISRAQITIASGQNLGAGAVLGQSTKRQAAAAVPTVVGTGNGTISDIRLGPDGQVGNYVITCTDLATNGGVFSVTAPDGNAIRSLTLTPGAGGSTRYASRHISFTITDGSTDFAVGAKFTVAVTAAAIPTAVGTGTGTLSAITLGPDAQRGTYRLVCTAVETHGGTFQVESPDGKTLPDLVMTAGTGGSTAYRSRHFNCTVTDATDFVLGDYFHLFVANGTGQYSAWDPTAVDGTQDAAGILFAAVDATSAASPGVAVVRQAEVNINRLAFDAAVAEGEEELAYSQLAVRNIIVR